MAAPANGLRIGTITSGNNATETHCDYEEIVTELKDKARAMGGNVVKITELAPPAFVGKCYKAKATVYAAPGYRDSVKKQINSRQAEVMQAGPHATLLIYRLKDTITMAGSYYVHLGDSVISETRSRSGDSVSIYKTGVVGLWAKKGGRRDIKIDIRAGETYYIRCGIVRGGIKLVPVLEQVDKAIGAAEYKDKVNHKRESGLRYMQEVH